jgi:anti-sigma B factor antagonist
MEASAGTGGAEIPDWVDDASGGLSVRVDDQGRTARVELAGYLDLGTAPQLREVLGELLRHPELEEVVLNVGEVSFCDAAGLAPLLKTLLALRERGGSLRLEEPQPALLRLLSTLHLAADFGL